MADCFGDFSAYVLFTENHDNNCGEQWIIDVLDMCNIGLSIASQKSR